MKNWSKMSLEKSSWKMVWNETMIIIVMAIAFVLLIPITVFAEYYDLCDIDCVPDNYHFGDDIKQDMEVIVCEDKLRLQEKLIVEQCGVIPQFYEKSIAELKQLWGEMHGPVIPEFYPMEPYFKQFTEEDSFCLLNSEDYRNCLADNGPLEDLEISSQEAYTLLYHGCHSAARNLIASEDMTREEASYVFNECEFFVDYIIEASTGSSQYKVICSAPDGYCMEKHGVNNPDSYGICLEKWIPFCKTYEEKEIACGKGTIEKNGQCVVDISKQLESKSSNGGGCLIATATYGSELAPQVQQLRELRDNTLLQTESGASFINSFNKIYYSFSPVIADYERENPIFREMVKVAITPMISSLSILNYVEMPSDQEVLGYGISLILLNLVMYFVAPAVLIIQLKKRSN